MEINFDEVEFTAEDSQMFENVFAASSKDGEEIFNKESAEEKGKTDIEEEIFSEFDEEKEEKKEVKKSSKKEEIENKAPLTDTKSDDKNLSFPLIFANFQKEEGLISDFNEEELNKIVEEEGEAAGLKYLADLTYEKAYEEARKLYSEDKNELEEFFKLKDSGVDPNVAKDLIFNKSKFEGITNDDLESDEDLRREVLAQHYRNTTLFSEAKIKKEVEKTIISGDDVEEALEAIKEVKEYNAKQIELEKKKVVENEKAQREFIKQQQQEIKTYIQGLDEVFQGQKLTKQIKDKMEAMILNPAKKLENGQTLNGIWATRMEDPKKFDTNLANLLVTGVFWGKTKELEKTVKTNAVKKLQDQLEGKNLELKGKNTIKKESDDSELFKAMGIEW